MKGRRLGPQETNFSKVPKSQYLLAVYNKKMSKSLIIIVF